MNSILVLKLHGVQVSNPFKIKYNQEMNLCLYPKDYFNRISEIEEFQRNLNSSNGEYYNCLIPELLSFEIGNDRITYLITESSIDAYQDNRALIQEVHNIFELFLRLNSFIFDFFILVQKIFIFSKKKDIYHLIRIVDLNIPFVKNTEGVLIYQLNSYDEEISSLFLKVNESELLQNIVKMLFEFIVSKNYSDLETRLIFTWNYLEHIAQIYASHKNRNLLIDKQKYEKIQEEISTLVNEKLETISLNPLNLTQIENKIRELFNNEFNRGQSLSMEKAEWRALLRTILSEIKSLLKDSDILIDGYDKEKISKLIIKYLDNFPPSEKLIELMLDDIGYKTNEIEDLTLVCIKKARNYLFHTSLMLEGLYQKFINDYDDISNFDFNDLKRTMKDFEGFLINITAEFFNSRIMKDKRVSRKGVSTLSISYPHISEHIDRLNLMIESFKNEFNSIKDYEDLLSIIIENDDKYGEAIQNSTLKGYCQGQDDREYVKFNLEFLDKFKAQGRFSGTVSYPQFYEFYIDLNKNIELDVLVKFKERLQLGSLSKPHKVSIKVLDFWFDKEKLYGDNEELLNLLNEINYNNH